MFGGGGVIMNCALAVDVLSLSSVFIRKRIVCILSADFTGDRFYISYKRCLCL